MSDDDRSRVGESEGGARDELDSVVVRQSPFAALSRAAGTSAALALAALIAAAATILTMSAASDIADAKFDSSGGGGLDSLRWAAGTRLVVAAIAVLLTVLAGFRYARDLPATRYTFEAEGEDVTESTEGAAAPGWVTTLLGAALIVSVLAVVLNATALAFALHLNESPNFGLPTG